MTEETSRGESLSELLARAEPSGAAFVVPERSGLTYAQLADRIETLAGCLAAAGVRHGDRVALTLPNGPDFVLLLLAITATARPRPAQPCVHGNRVHLLPDGYRPRLFLIQASKWRWPLRTTATRRAHGRDR
jgi:non-ribosomal peptide synthetase component E (peptide arylation enzyme)